MPYLEFTGNDGKQHVAIVCGRSLKSCYLCGRLSRYQCDYFVAPRPSTRRCNRHLCELHRTSLAPDKDACPEHAPICLAAIERKRAATA